VPKKLTDTQIRTLKEAIDGWNAADGPLTWEALLDFVKAGFGLTYTRQGLHKIEGIRIAYTVRKAALRRLTATSESASTELGRALERMARLEAERDRLLAENRTLQEQFIVWTYNASTRGLDEKFLSRPLPPIDRGATPGESSAFGRKARSRVKAAS
jgi:hypothetical protein